jgi:hypothetical protein
LQPSFFLDNDLFFHKSILVWILLRPSSSHGSEELCDKTTSTLKQGLATRIWSRR